MTFNYMIENTHTTLLKKGNAMSKTLKERIAAKKAQKATEQKGTLKERIASLKAKKASVVKNNKVRVASAWTVAKTLLPTAPNAIQLKLASALIDLDSKILTNCVRQAAVNAYWSKFAEDAEAAGTPLNQFVEEPSLLAKLKKEVESELKGEPKTADYTDPTEKQAELDADEKVHLHQQIEVAENAVEQLEHEIMNEGEEVLDTNAIFENTDNKVEDLANESEEEDDFGADEFGPSDSAHLESSLDGMEEVEVSDTADFFAQASEEEEFSDLFATAADTAEVEDGEASEYFVNDAVDHDVADSEEDHDGDLIFDVMMDLKPGTFETERQSEPKLEAPKAAKKKASRPIRSLGHVSQSDQEQLMLSKLVFMDDDDLGV